MTGFQPTGEQEKIRDAYLSGGALAVTAGAGTGKTSTLVLLGEARPARVRYIAFNKSTALDAERKFPDWVRPSTAHSLAWQAAGDRFRDRMDNKRHMPAKEVARILRLNEPLRLSERILAPHQVARLVMETVKHFCYSAAPEPNGLHVPHLKGVDSPGDKAVMRDTLAPLARRAWADLMEPAGQLRFQHDYYLKYWQLTGARISADVLFVDECQPTGTQVLIPAGEYRRRKGQSTPTRYVPIESIRPGDHVISYTPKSLHLRMTGSVVTDVRSRAFTGRLVTVLTPEGKSSRYTPEHKCMAAIGPALKGHHVVYLMQRGTSFRVGVTAGLHGNVNAGPRTRLQEERGDCAWILSVHETRAEALAEEAYTSWRFGIPEMRFRGNGPDQQPTIDSFWAKVGDLTESAEQCLGTHGRSIHYPLWRRGPRSTLTSRPMIIRACNLLDGMSLVDTDKMIEGPSHRRRVDGADLRPIKVSHEFYDGLVWSLEVEGDHTYIADGLVTHNCQDLNPVLEAIVAAQAAQVIAVGDACQQLYAWRGATDALDRLGQGSKLTLSQSFRFGPEVAREANKWLALLNADLRLSGTPSIPSRLGTPDRPRAILARSNAGVMKQVIAQVSAGRKVGMPSPRPGVPGGAEIEKLAKAAISLKQGRGTDHPELMAFQTWGEVQDYAVNDPGGEDLSVLVDLIDEHTPEKILSLTAQLVEERYAEVVVSTVHKAKGREWESVAVTDFRKPKRDPETGEVPLPARDQMMAAYVAVTRAKLLLDRGPLSFVDDYLTAGATA